MSDEFAHGHEPRAEEIALHQRFLTLQAQTEAASAEGRGNVVRDRGQVRNDQATAKACVAVRP